jgi:hypothetical protein
MRKTGRILALSLALGLAAAAAAFAQEEAALGNGGELYLVKTGSYGELFAGSADATGPDAANPVLAFDVLRPGAENGERERILVPGTDGPEVESLPSLFVEESSGTVFLLWESRINVIHPILVLSGFDGERWLDPISIIGSPFSPKTSPHFAVTRDAFQADGPGGQGGQKVTRHRTVVHIVWGEESSSGLSQTFYTPVFFEDGIYQGNSPVYRLNDFDTGDGAATSFETSPALAESPNIQGGRDGRTVVVGFASSTTRRLTTLEIDVLPAQLAQLADGARAHIIDIGARFYPGRLQMLADGARAHIIDIGYAYHPELVQSLADQVHRLILEGGSPSLVSLGDKARAHIIDIGAKFSGRGLKPQATQPLTAEGTRAEIREIRTPARPPQTEAPAHLVQFRVASQRPSPRIAADAKNVSLFLSADGEDVLIAWTDGGADGSVSYRDTSRNGWSDVRELRLSDGIDLHRAYEILSQQVRNR